MELEDLEVLISFHTSRLNYLDIKSQHEAFESQNGESQSCCELCGTLVHEGILAII